MFSPLAADCCSARGIPSSDTVAVDGATETVSPTPVKEAPLLAISFVFSVDAAAEGVAASGAVGEVVAAAAAAAAAAMADAFRERRPRCS